MPVGSRQIRTDHNHRDCHACPQRASDSNSCVGCAASALDCRDSLVPGRQNRRPAKRISKLGEISIALILDHDSVPDGGCDAHLRGHILPRSELDLGMALEELGEFEKSIRRSLAFLCRNSASPLCFGERTAGDCLQIKVLGTVSRALASENKTRRWPRRAFRRGLPYGVFLSRFEWDTGLA